MREFLMKINSNKALKFVFAAGLALVIFFIGRLLFPPEVPEDVSADIVVTQKAQGVNPGDNFVVNDNSNEDEGVREQLKKRSCSNDDYLIVYTFQEDVTFDKDYIENTLRPAIAQDMLDQDLFDNISVEQMTSNWRVEELEITDKKIAYFEKGTIKGLQYAASYIKLGDNFVYGAVFGIPGESENIVNDAAKNVNTYVADYIQQARAENANS